MLANLVGYPSCSRRGNVIRSCGSFLQPAYPRVRVHQTSCKFSRHTFPSLAADCLSSLHLASTQYFASSIARVHSVATAVVVQASPFLYSI